MLFMLTPVFHAEIIIDKKKKKKKSVYVLNSVWRCPLKGQYPPVASYPCMKAGSGLGMRLLPHLLEFPETLGLNHLPQAYNLYHPLPLSLILNFAAQTAKVLSRAHLVTTECIINSA